MKRLIVWCMLVGGLLAAQIAWSEEPVGITLIHPCDPSVTLSAPGPGSVLTLQTILEGGDEIDSFSNLHSRILMPPGFTFQSGVVQGTNRQCTGIGTTEAECPGLSDDLGQVTEQAWNIPAGARGIHPAAFGAE